jgi:multisubunit Na+/H+ antiporter MnhB subunit
MTMSSARLTPIRSTSKHNRRILLSGLALFILGASSAYFGTPDVDLTKLSFGAAGVAWLYVAQSEASAWRRPLTLGHQLMMWWFWPLVTPVYFLVTKKRRPILMTLIVVVPLIGLYVVGIAIITRDIMRIL